MQTCHERFFAKIKKGDGCWEWQGARSRSGYGGYKFRGRQWGAHRVAYTLLVGEILDGAQVLHRCDTPSCCRPDHLFLGTPKTNMTDKVLKNRQHCPRGILHPNKKLSEEDVLEIKRLHSLGELKSGQIGKMFGVTRFNVWKIAAGKSWSHLKESSIALP